jgi:tRNA/tmRNA/rRNA uracil-C5-methylase (TrmA/RlmC/RlmD family)
MNIHPNDIFKSTGWYYARYRPGHPEALFGCIRRAFHLDSSRRLLDLGCGTGQLALPLAKYFEEVIGKILSQK